LTHPGLLQVSSVKTAPRLTKAQQVGHAGSSPLVTTHAGRGGVMVSATGAMAQGLDVEQTGPGGLATAQCGSPGTSFWFVGPGQVKTADVELYLMNTDNVAADAQVSVLKDVTKGPPVLGNADNGITVPPHSIVVQSLSKLLRSSKVMALNVTTSVGRVVAEVRESRKASQDGGWLAPTQAPSRTLIIPGLPRSAGNRDLYVAVPGNSTAQVKITAVSTHGSYKPTGGANIDLLGNSTTAIVLPSLGGVAGALKVTSSVPISASMLVPGGPPGTPGAIAAAAGPIQEQAVFADNPARSKSYTELVLSAPTKAATVRVTTATTTSAASDASGQTVQIKAGASVVVPVRPPSGSKVTAFTVVITPQSGSGPVYAGRVINVHGAVQSILPASSSLTWIPLPPVQDSLSEFLH